ncbi:MAG: threonylcarbamoyl-AMP synthase [Clostridia bacterium]|nr:threonylcarbamoyl-AMP synthase [Clostridia bacterium]
MDTRIERITDTTEYGETLDAAARIILSGGLVVFPTETVYGLGGNGLLSDAARKIYSAKGRPSDNPLIIHIAEPRDAENYASTSEVYYRLADAFMPGPLTVIMKKRDCIPMSVTGGLDTVAVRCPSHPIAHALIEKCGVPIAAPSANISGRPSPTSAEYVVEDMNGRVDMIIDGGECEIGLESTIVKIDGNSLTLLRPGAITYDALCCVCENVKIAPAVLNKLAENEKPLSPGMKYRHYAPSSDFVLLDGEKRDALEFMKKEQIENNCAVLCYDEEFEYLNASLSISIGKENDLSTQAKRLFTALREADKLGANKIYAHLPTPTGLGLALYNRMIRAAAHTIMKV